MKKALASLLVALVALIAPLAALASGDVIGKFFGGVPGDNEFTGVVALPDGKFVAVGYARFDGVRQLVAVRYVARGLSNTSSPVDTSFGDQGVAKANFGVDAGAWWRAALQDDGKIVAAGAAGANMALARFNADGSLDATFGNGGIVTVAGTGGALAIALAPGGQIYAGGGSLGANPAMFVARFNADGTLDSTYGTGGIATAAVDSSTSPSRGNYLHSLYLLPDGRMLFGGEYASRTRGTRYGRLLPTGAFDATFNGGAPVDVPNFMGAWEMARQSTGQIVVAGSAILAGGGAYLAALRMDTDGNLDASFGNGGVATVDGTTSAPDTLAAGTGIAVQSTDRIVVFGTQSQGAFGTRGYAGRLLTDGTPDSTFHIGVSGNRYVGTAGFAMARFADDRLAVVGRYSVQGFGSTNAYKDMDAVVDKLETTGEWGNDFHWTQSDGGTPLIVDLGFARAVVTGAARQSDGHIVVVGEVVEEAQGPFITRFNPDGTQDTAFNSRFPPSYKINAVAVDASDQPVYAGSFRDAGGPYRPWLYSPSRFNQVFPTATDAVLRAVAIQGDGKPVGAGWIQNGAAKDSLFVRLVPNVTGGDTTFGSNGIAIASVIGGDDVMNAVAVQADGRIVGAGWAQLTASQTGFAVARLNANGAADTSFAGTGHSAYALNTSSSLGNAVATYSDGRILVGGSLFNGTTDDMALLRLQPNGALDTTFRSSGWAVDDFGNHNRIHSLAILANGKITAGGENGGTFGAAQWLPSGQLDTTFGSGGSAFVSMSGHYLDSAATLLVLPDGNLDLVGDADGALGIASLTGDTSAVSPQPANVSLSSSKNPSNVGDQVQYTASVTGSSGTPTGTVTLTDNGSPVTGCSNIQVSNGSFACFASLPAGNNTLVAQYSGDATYAPAQSDPLTQVVNASSSSGFASLSPTSVDFGRVSMGTTSVIPRDVTLTNTGAQDLHISAISVSGPFTQSNNCPATLASGSSCTIGVLFVSHPEAGPVNEEIPVSGALTVESDASNGAASTSLSGTEVKSLIDHFYRWILHRSADPQGRDYWRQQAEAAIARGQNVNEAWYQLAEFILGSQEYARINDTPQDFVRDLYRTFFNREADAEGQAYWENQIFAGGIPERGVRVSFMFSPEFQQFTQSVFGNTQARAEIDVVGDFYRGLLARLPDDSGFSYWVGRFRTAQCQGAAAVSEEAEAISSQFLASAEYANRATTDKVFVADLYDAFMRRGPDKSGLDYWVGELQAGRQTRDQVRHGFEQSPEFQSRVNAVANQGCLQ